MMDPGLMNQTPPCSTMEEAWVCPETRMSQSSARALIAREAGGWGGGAVRSGRKMWGGARQGAKGREEKRYAPSRRYLILVVASEGRRNGCSCRHFAPPPHL